MSSTNKTPNYNLTQFIDSDKPSWRGDYNADMSKIDTGIKGACIQAQAAATIATDAKTLAEDVKTFTQQVKTTADNALSLAQTNEEDIAAHDSEFQAYKTSTDTQLSADTQRLNALDDLVATKKTTPPEGWQVGTHLRAYHPAESTSKEFVSSGVRVHYSQLTGNGVGKWASNQDDDVLLTPGTYLFTLHSRITGPNVNDRSFRAYFGFKTTGSASWTYPNDLYADSFVAQLGSTSPAHEIRATFVWELDDPTLVEVKYNIIGTGETVTATMGMSTLYVIRLNDGTGATRHA